MHGSVGTSLAALAAAVEALCGGRGLIELGGRAMRPGEPRAMVADTDRLVGATGFHRSFTLTDAIAAYLNDLCAGLPAATPRLRASASA